MIASGRSYVGPTFGVSMRPMLKEGRDSVVIDPKTDRLVKGDVALYKRDGKLVLHRVIKVTDSGYIIRGDNCYSDENVSEESVIGVLTGYFRGEKGVLLSSPRYRFYAFRRVKFYPVRAFFRNAAVFIHGLFDRKK